MRKDTRIFYIHGPFSASNGLTSDNNLLYFELVVIFSINNALIQIYTFNKSRENKKVSCEVN